MSDLGMLIGTNVLSNTYWSRHAFVDLANQMEPPFHLPQKADGSDDWSQATVVPTRGRVIPSAPGRVRSTVINDQRVLYGLKIAVLWRGQGELRALHNPKYVDLTPFAIHGEIANVRIYDKTASTDEYHAFTLEINNPVDFELVGVVEVDDFGSFVRGEIASPVLQAVWDTLKGPRRLMDWCGVECEAETIDYSPAFTRSDFYYDPITHRAEVPGHGPLPMLHLLAQRHPGQHWICIPHALKREAIVELGRKWRDVAERPAVAFTNEAWNTLFPYVGRFQANKPGTMHAAEWYVRHAIPALQAFEEGFGGRVIRVCEWQAADNWAFGRDPWHGNRPSIQYVHDAIPFFDVLAIAPYLFNDNRPVTQDEFEQHMLVLEARCAWWMAVAAEHGKKLWAYEGLIEIPGPHNADMRDSPQMTRWVKSYLQRMEPFFEKFCIYTATGPVWGLIEGNGFSYHRAFGVQEYLNDQIKSAPLISKVRR